MTNQEKMSFAEYCCYYDLNPEEEEIGGMYDRYAHQHWVNLTQHSINIYLPGGEIQTIPPSGVVARVTENREEGWTLMGIPWVKLSYGEIENLPEKDGKANYIVSALVRGAITSYRDDVYSPDTGKGAVRDAGGNLLGVKGLVR